MRQQIEHRVFEYVDKTPPHSRSIFWAKRAFYSILSISLLTSSAVFLSWFTRSAEVTRLFSDYIGDSFVGWVWMWFPELLLISIIMFALGLIIAKQADMLNNSMTIIASTLAYCLIGFVFFLMPNTNVVANNGIPNPLQQQVYRSQLRDDYITHDLNTKQEYFGVISTLDCTKQELSIDHGGVIKSFIIHKNCEKLQLGSAIWIKHIDNHVQQYTLIS
jgi:hypothetical protein